MEYKTPKSNFIPWKSLKLFIIIVTFQAFIKNIMPRPVNRKWSQGPGAALPTKTGLRKASLGPPSTFSN